jgi:hypothetical protein
MAEYNRYTKLKELIGATVKKIFMNDEYLKFETDKGDFLYAVEGDCCSHSYLYDFYGVKNLLNNGPITDVKTVEIDSEKAQEAEVAKRKEADPNDYGIESLRCYGYQLTTISPEFGEVTSVFSFRNESNGYYGGSITQITDDNREVSPEVTKDIIEIKTK